MSNSKGPIGIFDSGMGGLTVFHAIRERLPAYDYCYLGDSARTPYGTRSFDVICRYTRQGVMHLLEKGCPLVILACNTASAKALRCIQQKDLPQYYPDRRVLGVIRPSVELAGVVSKSRKIGLFGTSGTVRSDSYGMELKKLFPDIRLFQEACPMWVPLVENNEVNTPAADYFVRRHTEALLEKGPDIDTVILACTHYPLLLPLIRKYLPAEIRIIDQGPAVAERLEDYLRRHTEIRSRCGTGGQRQFLTTAMAEDFEKQVAVFFGKRIKAETTELH
jgi:glutamate racemase